MHANFDVFCNMKQIFSYLLAGYACLLMTCLVGCEADVDLSNVDMTAAVKADIALPIGSMKVHFGDFIGDTTIQHIHIDEQGRYVFYDTIEFSEIYHEVDITEYTSYLESTLDIRKRLEEQYPSLANLPAIPAHTPFYIDFPITLKLNNMNDDVKNQRIDSIIVDWAQFHSKFDIEGIDLSWDEVKKIEIRLSEDFRRSQGKVLEVPSKGYGFNTDIPILVDDFHLILMRDPKATPSNSNVKDSTSFTMRFYIEPTKALTIEKGDKIRYNFELDFINYSAVFGYFDASNKMYDAVEDYLLADAWSGWSTLNGLMLPLREPKLTFHVNHTLAMPLIVNLEELNVLAEDSVTRKEATFNGQPSTRILLPNQISLSDPLDKRAVDTIVLDYTDAWGNLDELFKIHPIWASYSYYIEADTTTDMKQFRITDDTHIYVDAAIEAPLDFDDGVNVVYSDTIDSIYIEEFTLKSLLLSMDSTTEINVDSTYDAVDSILDVQDCHLQLFLTLENYIPFEVMGSFRFYNENDSLITFNGDSTRTQYDILLDCPTDIVDGEVVTPVENELVLAIAKGDFKNISSIRKIVFTASIGKNAVPAKLTTNSALCAYIGVAADVSAIVDVQSLFGEEESVRTEM